MQQVLLNPGIKEVIMSQQEKELYSGAARFRVC
jgi:hypothetical protein